MEDAIDIVVLAAGAATRFGRPKQLEPVRGVAMVRRAAQAALATGLRVNVVIGAHAEAVSGALQGLPLTLVLHPTWATGMGGSIACGIRVIAGKSPASSAAIVCLADQPAVDAADLCRLVASHSDHPGHIIAADYGDAIGPPCLFPRAFYDALGALDGTRGARALLGRHPDRVVTVAMPNARVDINVPDDLRANFPP